MLRFLILAVMIAASWPAAASPAGVIDTDHLRAEIIVRNAATRPGERTDLAIRHTLDPGWHTYWENPGDSGEPPIAAWSLPDNAVGAPLRFPTPATVPYPPLMNYGYSGEFTLLTEVAVPADWPTGQPYPVSLRMDWLVCAEICIPEGGDVTFNVATGPATEPDSGVAFGFLQAGWAMPSPSDAAATYSRGDDGTLYLTVPGATTANAYFYSHDRDAVDHTAPQPAVAASDGVGITLALSPGRGRLDGALSGVLVTAAGASAISATGEPDLPSAASAAPAEGTIAAASVPTAPALIALAAPAPLVTLWQGVLFAFLGGAILNLMPCVFPVLALKAIGLIAHADAPLARRAAVGGAYTMGILVSFAAVASALFALKAAGVAVGWGFQLQSPPFVAAMALVIFLVALNLSGLFEVGAGATRLGSHAPRDGLAGSFATGALTTLVATPCTAPFMAVALGAALAAPLGYAAAVFLALGLGLAAPFVALALMPGLSRVLPRPGVWMLRLKQALAFPLYLTAAWLVWVLAQLIGVDALLPALMAFVLIACAAWLYGLSQRGGGRSHRVATGLSAVSLAGALFAMWPSAFAPPDAALAATAPRPGAESYTPERLAALSAEGQPVFLNVTAAWCITCAVNERVLFGTDTFAKLLEDADVSYMTADWTRRDPDVTRLIERFGRAGVPLYVYFPAQGTPEVLPQLLNASILATAFAD